MIKRTQEGLCLLKTIVGSQPYQGRPAADLSWPCEYTTTSKQTGQPEQAPGNGLVEANLRNTL